MCHEYFSLLTGNISNYDWPVSWQLKRNWSPHQPQHQPIFSNELGVNFEFEFCNNIEDRFNGGMSCITYSVVLHVYLRRSQILLTFNRLQVIYSVFSIIFLVEAVYKGLFILQQNSKVQGQALVFDHSQYCYGLMLHFKLYNYIFYLVLLN